MFLAYILAFIAGLCLYLEFFLPGGIFAIIAGIFAVLGVIFALYNASFLWIGLAYIVCLLLLLSLVVFLALKQIRKSSLFFCLKKDQEGFTAPSLDKNLVGKDGIVATELKPAGHVRVEGNLYQAVSQGGFLPQGSLVEVIGIRGAALEVKVKKIDKQQ